MYHYDISVDWSLLKAGTTLHSAPAFRTAPVMTLADPSSVSKSCNKVSIGESADGTQDGMDRQVERTWCPWRNPSRARPFQGRTPLCTERFSTLTVTLCLTAGNQVSPSPQAASVTSESRARDITVSQTLAYRRLLTRLETVGQLRCALPFPPGIGPVQEMRSVRNCYTHSDTLNQATELLNNTMWTSPKL